MPLRVAEVLELASAEIRAASTPFLTMDFEAHQALAMLGILQLVARHPLLSAYMRDLVAELADAIECQLASLGPATRQICRQGWNPDCDEDPS